MALAGPAQKQARAVADHMYRTTSRNQGVIGSSSIRLFDLNAASTRLNARTAEQANIPYVPLWVNEGA